MSKYTGYWSFTHTSEFVCAMKVKTITQKIIVNNKYVYII